MFGLFVLAHKTVDCSREPGGRIHRNAASVLAFAVSFTGAKARRLSDSGSASKTVMNALGDIVFGFTRRRPPQKAAATGARRWRVAKHLRWALAIFAITGGARGAYAQDAQGPLTPAPSEEHKGRRVGARAGTPAPPSFPPGEGSRRFFRKGSEVFSWRPHLRR